MGMEYFMYGTAPNLPRQQQQQHYSGATLSENAVSTSNNNGYYDSPPPAEYLYSFAPASAEALIRVDDLLDLSNNNAHHHHFHSVSGTSAFVGADHSQHQQCPAADFDLSSSSSAPAPATAHGAPFSCDTSISAPNRYHYDFCIPTDEAAELEWLSKFVDDSYSDVPASGYMISPTVAAGCAEGGGPITAVPSTPGKAARSKRSRVAAAAWQSVVVAPKQHSSPSSSSSSSDFPAAAAAAATKGPSKGRRGERSGSAGGEEVGPGAAGVRRCTHCASEKTPQWRTGPLGPKTLCNACGVRFKSGRLMPEYRPAASPTFVLTQHSNSHRKVMELRRQKDMILQIHGHDFDGESGSATKSGLLFHEYGV